MVTMNSPAPSQVVRPFLGLASLIWLFALVIALIMLGDRNDETIASWPKELGKNGGFPHVGVFLFGLYFFVNLFGLPVGCLLGLHWAHDRIRLKILFGTLAGAIGGLWLGSLLLTVPYLGGYPNLPAFFAGMVVRRCLGFPEDSPVSPLGIIAVDVLFGACFGCFATFVYRLANRPRMPLDTDPEKEDIHKAKQG
jgi:hypothetical protein